MLTASLQSNIPRMLHYTTQSVLRYGYFLGNDKRQMLGLLLGGTGWKSCSHLFTKMLTIFTVLDDFQNINLKAKKYYNNLQISVW